MYREPCTLAGVDDKVEPAANGPLAPRDMSRTHYVGLFEPEQIPAARDSLIHRLDVVSYRSGSEPKAAAYHPWGRLFIVVGGGGQFQAEELALSQCNSDPDRKGRDGPCFLYALGDRVVLPQLSIKPLSRNPSGDK
jgi:hypothetical protein